MKGYLEIEIPDDSICSILKGTLNLEKYLMNVIKTLDTDFKSIMKKDRWYQGEKYAYTKILRMVRKELNKK